MFLKCIILFLHIITILSTPECQFHEDIQAYETIKTDNSLLYLYIPIKAIGVAQNSIEIFNESGEVLTCLNMEDFKEEANLIWEDPSFFMVKYIKDELYTICYVSDIETMTVALNNAYYIIVDEYFNIKKEYPVIEMSPNVESSVFESDANVNMHDIIITEDLKYAIFLVKEQHTVTDIQKYFPDSTLKSAKIAADGLCVLDLKTGKEFAALSINGILIDFDNWIDYVREEEYFYFYEDDLITIDDIAGFLDIAYLNSINMVDGSHFSPRYENVKMLIINSLKHETIYLLRWDFETDGSYEIIWKLPGHHAIDIVKKDWANKWEYVNDAFYGFSDSHDANVYNAPKGHILVYDNGSSHRASNRPGIACPMSRGVEYKIEMDINGKIGYNRITLVFSYPKIEDYPNFVYLKDAPNFEENKCEDFWNGYNWQLVFGSFRRTKDGYYIMTNYPRDVYGIKVTIENTTRMFKLDRYGNVVSGWNSEMGNTVSYRILPLDKNVFRNGMYLNFTNVENEILI